MHTSPSRTSTLIYALSLTVLLMPISQHSPGQINSRAAGITLVARLESLSVAAALIDNDSSTAQRLNRSHAASVSVTTSWAVPSNLTTVRVVENGMPLFSQAAGDSNRPGMRTDLLNVALPHDKPEGMSAQDQHRTVTIFVQAL
jgi:hypothetical protein